MVLVPETALVVEGIPQADIGMDVRELVSVQMAQPPCDVDSANRVEFLGRPPFLRGDRGATGGVRSLGLLQGLALLGAVYRGGPPDPGPASRVSDDADPGRVDIIQGVSSGGVVDD